MIDGRKPTWLSFEPGFGHGVIGDRKQHARAFRQAWRILLSALARISGIARHDDPLHFCLGTMVNESCDTLSPGIARYGLAIAAAMNAALP